MTQHRFEIPNAIDDVDPLVMTIREHAAKVLSDEARFRLELCVAEALTNLVKHASTPVAAAPIKVLLSLYAGRTRVEIFDPVGAAPFDLRDDATDLSEVDVMSESGRGLALIMECADTVEYGPSGESHSLCLEFRDRTPEPNTSPPVNGTSK